MGPPPILNAHCIYTVGPPPILNAYCIYTVGPPPILNAHCIYIHGGSTTNTECILHLHGGSTTNTEYAHCIYTVGPPPILYIFKLCNPVFLVRVLAMPHPLCTCTLRVLYACGREFVPSVYFLPITRNGISPPPPPPVTHRPSCHDFELGIHTGLESRPKRSKFAKGASHVKSRVEHG